MKRSPPPKTRNRAENPDPVDIHVGARMRRRRTLIGLSQEQLGVAAGLTFQQIQKYERGTNRMGASRLYQMARILGITVSYFFEDMPSEITSPPSEHGFSDTAQEPLEDVAEDEAEILHRRETLELIRFYYGISDPKQRRKVFGLIKTMAE